MPDTAVGSANGMSMMASTNLRPGKVVAHQRPGQREAEHHVHAGGDQRGAERQPVGRERARAGDHLDETRPVHARGLEHQRGQRQQHDGATERTW